MQKLNKLNVLFISLVFYKYYMGTNIKYYFEAREIFIFYYSIIVDQNINCETTNLKKNFFFEKIPKEV